jgi:hypothetical protein
MVCGMALLAQASAGGRYRVVAATPDAVLHEAGAPRPHTALSLVGYQARSVSPKWTTGRYPVIAR